MFQIMQIFTLFTYVGRLTVTDVAPNMLNELNSSRHTVCNMAKNWNSRMIEEIFYKTDKFDIAVCGLIMSWFRNLAQAIIEKKKVFGNKLRNRHFRIPAVHSIKYTWQLKSGLKFSLIFFQFDLRLRKIVNT